MPTTTPLAEILGRQDCLAREGQLEQNLIAALVFVPTNNHRVSLAEIERTLRTCDRERLRACGHPLPEMGSFPAFRGVSGWGKFRHQSGMSWTMYLPVAYWFAVRYKLTDPAVVYVTEIELGTNLLLRESGGRAGVDCTGAATRLLSGRNPRQKDEDHGGAVPTDAKRIMPLLNAYISSFPR